MKSLKKYLIIIGVIINNNKIFSMDNNNTRDVDKNYIVKEIYKIINTNIIEIFSTLLIENNQQKNITSFLENTIDNTIENQNDKKNQNDKIIKRSLNL
jgi:hypothetical protein